MADINSSDLTGGGSLLATSSFTGGQINSGTSSDVTISCPAGKYLRLTLLYAGGTQSGVTISFGVRTIASGLIRRADQFSSSNLNIGNPPQTNGNNGTALSYIQGKKDENLVFSFSSATSQTIYYAYEVLEDA